MRERKGRRNTARDSDKHTEDEDIDEQDKESKNTTTSSTTLRHGVTRDRDLAGEDKWCQAGLDEEGGEGGCAGCHDVEGCGCVRIGSCGESCSHSRLG